MTVHVCITGGAGLIGFSLAKKLLKQGYIVTLFDLSEQINRRKYELSQFSSNPNLKVISGTIMDRWAVSLACRNAHVVYHLAAMLGVKRTEDNRLLCMDINVNGTDNVLNACVQNNIRHVVVASSSEVYGEPTTNPLTEESETKGKTVYAVSKLASEELVKGYHQLHPDLNYTIARFFNTYGEGQVAQFVISKFVKRILDGKNPQVYGSGQQTRSYCHVSDVVKALSMICTSPDARNKVYNIGNPSQKYSLVELAQLCIEVLAPAGNLEVDYVPFASSDRDANREINCRYCNIDKLVSDLGFTPTISVIEGIELISKSVIHDYWT